MTYMHVVDDNHRDLLALNKHKYVYTKAAGTGQAAQAKTGPLFRPLDMVMVVKCVNGRPILHAIRSNCGSRTVPLGLWLPF